MAYLKNLLYYYNNRNFIKYGAHAILLLYCFALIQILYCRYYADYKVLDPGQIYVLVWDSYYLTMSNENIFQSLKCRVKNCKFTENKDLLDGDYTRFDALIFTEKLLRLHNLPDNRSKSQIYIFSTIESSYNYPACEVKYDDFFNLTFTYRLDSDVLWPYFVVRNATRHVVGPSEHVQWQAYDNRAGVPAQVRKFFRNRTKAAAWLVSHCEADSLRDNYLSILQEHLYHFAIHIDVYGRCSNKECTNGNCAEMLRKDYYFYMAFENSLSEDYVTEKVLHGYDNYVVPIVYGGANYTRFLPPGSYLNARNLHPYNLAFIMHLAMKNKKKYYEFFKWTNYYTVDSTEAFPDVHPLCNLCEALNSYRFHRQRKHQGFRRWWNGKQGMQWCLPKQYWSDLRVDRRHLIEMF